MRRLLSVLMVSSALLAGAGSASAQVSIGIQIGPPPAPRAYRVPPRPAPDYEWVEGYWYPEGHRYVWHDGYWTHAPYRGAYWVAPYYVGGRYFPGRWEGERGVVEHDHRWDHDARRDEAHEPHRDERR
jgi:hypothetical protein